MKNLWDSYSAGRHFPQIPIRSEDNLIKFTHTEQYFFSVLSFQRVILPMSHRDAINIKNRKGQCFSPG